MSGAAAPLRILITTDAYPPSSGGSGWSTHALARGLLAAGHGVEVIHFAARDPAPAAETHHDGVTVRRIGLGGARTWRRHLASADYSREPVRQLVAGHLREHPEIDVVHGQHLHSGQGAVLAARAAGRAAVLTLRDYWPVRLDGIAWPTELEASAGPRRQAERALTQSFGVPRPLAVLLAGRALRRLRTRQEALDACDRVLCVSTAVRDRIAGSTRARVEVVPNMIDPDHARAAAAAAELPVGVTPPYLFTAGKLNAMKGYDVLVDELADAGCELPLVVAGTGALEQHLRERARARDIDLTLLGWTDGPTTLRLTAEARAALVPSAWEEPLARVILEAMAVGTPVIARATGGSVDAITSGRDGFLYRDVAELAEALAAVNDPAAAVRLGDLAAATCAARYAPDVVLRRVEAAYRNAMEDAGRGD